MKKTTMRNCAHCSEPYRGGQKFCSRSCSNKQYYETHKGVKTKNAKEVLELKKAYATQEHESQLLKAKCASLESTNAGLHNVIQEKGFSLNKAQDARDWHKKWNTRYLVFTLLMAACFALEQVLLYLIHIK